SRRAGDALEAPADDDRHVDDVRPRQELRQRQHVEELELGEPAPLLHDHAPREGHYAAESGQADLEEPDEKLRRADRCRGSRRGRKSVKSSRSMRMSPGRCPKPSFASKGQTRPTATRMMPSVMSRRDMTLPRRRIEHCSAAGARRLWWSILPQRSFRHAKPSPL